MNLDEYCEYLQRLATHVPPIEIKTVKKPRIIAKKKYVSKQFTKTNKR